MKYMKKVDFYRYNFKTRDTIQHRFVGIVQVGIQDGLENNEPCLFQRINMDIDFGYF